jgi:hypothetical protein
MNEYKKLQLGSLVKLAVDSRGITNGSMDILSFEYDINSEIDKIIDYVDNNDFPELKNEIDIIKQKNDILEDKIKNFALEILTLQNDTEQLNQLIQEYNSTVADQYNNLVSLTYQILNKLEPKIIYKDKIIIKKEYIEYRTTVYKGVKSDQQIEDELEIIKSNRKILGKSGWFEYSTDWMVQLLYGREIVFMKKNLYNRCLNSNIPFYGMYDAKKWHKQYDA